MSQLNTEIQPILGLDTEFPSDVYLLSHPSSGKFGCYCHNGIHGLACFSTESAAFRFAEWIDLSGMTTVECSFDEAREVAKDRPMPIVSLMLLDKIDDPKIHFIR